MNPQESPYHFPLWAKLLWSALILLCAGEAAGIQVEKSLSLTASRRTDKLDWNIAGDTNGQNPNILSELTWQDLRIQYFELEGMAVLNRTIVLKGSFGRGKITSGENQDADFFGDNRTLEFSRSRSDAGGGSVEDVSIALGRRFPAQSLPLVGTVFLGYALNEQALTMKNGEQVSDPLGVFGLGAFPGLNSRYDATWKGPWIGLDLSYRRTERLTFFGAVEYHVAAYSAEADWNLRADFAHPKSFEHEAKGRGLDLSGGFQYGLSESLDLDFLLLNRNWSTQEGNDRTFFASGSTAETQLNEVNWESLSVRLGLKYRFSSRLDREASRPPPQHYPDFPEYWQD